MLNRVTFKKEKLRELFFDEILSSSKFNSWKELREKVRIPKSRLEFYRNGKYSIPLDRYNVLASLLPAKRKHFFDTKLVFLENNWGASKGGVVTARKHPEIFREGRRIAWMGRLNVFDTSMPLTGDMCEFIGAFIGDGFTNRYKNSYVIQFTGDARLDYAYFKDFLEVVAKDVFGLRGYLYRKDNTLRLTFHSKLLHEFIVKRLGMPAGKKSYTVKIPEEILGKCPEHLPALIRGIYNTDGCVFFDKRYKPHYPRVYLKMINQRLIAQVYDVLDSLHLNPTRNIDGFVIQINGAKNVKKFIQRIGFSNPRHINRIKKSSPDLLLI